MDTRSVNVLSNLAFKTQCFRKNYDLFIGNDNIITEYTGTISKLRLSERKPPLIIGEYALSTWNISLAKLLGINIKKLFNSHKNENTYDELINVINSDDFNINNYKKVLFIQGLIIHPDYRKIGVTEEFIEFIYRDFYYENTAIIALVKPIQDNHIDADVYFNHKTVNVFNDLREYDKIPALNFYGLDELIKNKDTESNEYRLFSVAARCGFQRIGDESHLFLFSPEIIINRLKEKMNLTLNDIE